MAIQQARWIRQYDPAKEETCATAAMSSSPSRVDKDVWHHETSDTYSSVIADLCDRHRVVFCKDALQWILQRRKKGDAERPWRSVGYLRTRNALVRACASLCDRIDPVALAILVALPDHIGGAA